MVLRIETHSWALAKPNVLREDVSMVTAKGIKRRLDEGVKDALLHQDHSAASVKPTSVLRLNGQGDESYIVKLMQQNLKATMVSAQRTLRCEGVVCFVEDSSGHGCPSEDTDVCIIWDANADYALHGPPLVFDTSFFIP